ncbi:MAG: hypothetical protein JJT82_03820 [Legionellaceae bacterium]|nr:hypothetical protein [Legionellaceae bacterium]
MFTANQVLGHFYQGLKLLVEFETQKTPGSPQALRGAVEKIAALFESALAEGDTIAPFFLYYLAEKYDGVIDTARLPELSNIPALRETGRDWREAYEEYLRIHQEIEEITQKLSCPSAHSASNKQHARLKKVSRQRRLEQVVTDIQQLVKSPCGLSGLLAARLVQKFGTINKAKSSKAIDAETQTIAHYYEQSAFHPNPWALYEYWHYLSHTQQLKRNNSAHQRVLTELELLKNNQADIIAVIAHYKNTSQPEDASPCSRWQLLSALHGHIDNIFRVIIACVNGNVQRNMPISRQEELDQALKWFDWLYNNAPQHQIDRVWKMVAGLCQDHHKFIGNTLNKAILTAYSLFAMECYLSALPDSLPYIAQLDLLPALRCSHDIIGRVLELNEGSLPLPLSEIPKLNNEAGQIALKNGNHAQAERFYRQSLLLAPTDAIVQHNLANILNIQDKEHPEQLKLYFLAAEQGCLDSLNQLFIKTIVKKHENLGDLGRLLSLYENSASESNFPVPRELLILMIKITIQQRSQPEEDQNTLVWTIIDEPMGNTSYQAHFRSGNLDIHSDSEDYGSGSSCSSDADDDPLPEKPRELDSREPAAPMTEAAPSAQPSEQVSKQALPTAVEHLQCHASFFKPSPKENTETLPPKQQKALKKIRELSEKPTKSLTLRDLIEAKKAYNIFQAKSGGVPLSSKGKTSGSRIEIDGICVHLAHGKDRSSPGAQKDIQRNINKLNDELKHALQPKG